MSKLNEKNVIEKDGLTLVNEDDPIFNWESKEISPSYLKRLLTMRFLWIDRNQIVRIIKDDDDPIELGMSDRALRRFIPWKLKKPRYLPTF